MLGASSRTSHEAAPRAAVRGATNTSTSTDGDSGARGCARSDQHQHQHDGDAGACGGEARHVGQGSEASNSGL